MNTYGINSDLVKKLRERESAFQRYKIHMLLAGIFQISLAGFMVVLIQKYDRLLQSSELGSMASLISWLMILSAVVGWIMIVTCIRDWRGNPTNLLLLQLIDRETNHEDKPNKTTLPTPDPPPVPASITATTPSPCSTLARGQA